MNWQPFVTPIHHDQSPGPVGFAYFDGFSYDAPDANIAYFIDGQGNYRGNPLSPGARLPFLGNPDGSAVNSFYFQSEGQEQQVDFLSFRGLWSPYNSLGWYDPNSAAWGWILQANGTGPTAQTVDFTPTGNFGLFFVPDSLTFNPAPSYYTDSARNGIASSDVDYARANGISLGPEDYQHFAVFDDLNGGYFVGVKDRSLQIGDGDYNDMIFRLQSLPEPYLFPPMAAILVLLAIWRVRVNSH